MLRYMRRLEAQDLSLTHSMIPLGSCTMKLNATVEMMPVTWPEWGRLHPFAPAEQADGLPRDVHQPREDAVRDHRLRRDVAAAERRLAGRVRGPAGDPRLPREPRPGTPRRLPDPVVRARHQPGVGRDGRLPRRGRRLRRRRQRRSRRPGREGGAAQGRARRADGHLPVDARRVRGRDPPHLRDHPRARRAGVHGRRQPERAGRPLPPGRHRRRRLPPQPAQDVLHPARRRRPRHGPDLRRRPPGAVPAPPPGRRRPAAIARSAPCRPRPGAAPASC